MTMMMMAMMAMMAMVAMVWPSSSHRRRRPLARATISRAPPAPAPPAAPAPSLPPAIPLPPSRRFCLLAVTCCADHCVLYSSRVALAAAISCGGRARVRLGAALQLAPHGRRHHRHTCGRVLGLAPVSRRQLLGLGMCACHMSMQRYSSATDRTSLVIRRWRRRPICACGTTSTPTTSASARCVCERVRACASVCERVRACASCRVVSLARSLASERPHSPNRVSCSC